MIQGGFKEPYCSSKCYEQAGGEITKRRIAGQSGECAICQSHVFASIENPGECAFFPYRGGLFFICKSCIEKAKNFVNKIDECCLCGKHLFLDANAHADNKGQPENGKPDDSATAQEMPSVEKKGFSFLAGAELTGLLAWVMPLILFFLAGLTDGKLTIGNENGYLLLLGIVFVCGIILHFVTFTIRVYKK